MPVTVKPVATWQQDTGPDPSWRYAVLAVTGAAPGVWSVRNNGAGWYLHISHNGAHVGMANWEQWDAVARIIAHESGPYTVRLKDGGGTLGLTGKTLTQAKIMAVTVEKVPGVTATVTNPDGNEVRWPRRDNPKD